MNLYRIDLKGAKEEKWQCAYTVADGLVQAHKKVTEEYGSDDGWQVTHIELLNTNGVALVL